MKACTAIGVDSEHADLLLIERHHNQGGAVDYDV